MKNFKKACMVALLAAGMVLGATAGAQAIDFKAKGDWRVSFGLGDMGLVNKSRTNAGVESRATSNDYFTAEQRVRLQLEAVASEALSGTIWFEIGSQEWGLATNNNRWAGTGGGSLGADGIVVKVKNAYLDWIVPQTDLKFRMGIQAVKLPSAAGGTAILDADIAGVTASYQFNDNVGLTAFWYRPVNDNYVGPDNGAQATNYLDNMDIFGFALPLTFDGVKVTPWFAYAAIGRNALKVTDPGSGNYGRSEGLYAQNLLNIYAGNAVDLFDRHTAKNAYSNAFFFGLPVVVNAWDPLNIEFDFNYGYVEGFGRYDGRDLRAQYENRAARAAGQPEPYATSRKRINSRRSGWLAKALVEYKLDWGVPGIFGWYGSGDDDNIKNGSERMPSIAGGGNFTYLGQAGLDFGMNNCRGTWKEWNNSYAGTWGIGVQIRDMSFVEDLKHTLRIAYWGGTNSTGMTKYFNTRSAWNNAYHEDGPYLTTNDGLLEFDLGNQYKIYENLTLDFEMAYIVNMVNKGTWDRRWMGDSMAQRKDAWKAQLAFTYAF